MSNLRTGIRLEVGQGQYDPLATSPASHRAEILIPCNKDGSAIMVQPSALPGSASTIRASAVLTTSYVGSTAVDLAQSQGVVVRALVTLANSGETFSLKPQWSIDGTNWSDESVLVNATLSGSEQQYDPASRVVLLDATTLGNSYIERFNRLARYFRIAAKSSDTSAKLSLTAQLL